MAIDAEQLADIEQQIVEDVMAGVQRFSNDNESVESMSLKTRLDALTALEQRQSQAAGSFGMPRFFKMNPPGAG